VALIIPCGPSFANYSDNFGPITADDASGFGVGITAGTSSADGTAVTIMPALAHDCEYLWLAVSGLGTSNSANAALMDVLIDPAGGTNWSVLISDLLVGFSTTILYNATGAALPRTYHFPLWIKAGASLGARIRMQSASAPSSTRVLAAVFGGNKNPASWWTGQKVESVATFDAANSLGQLHTPGGGTSVSGAADNGSGLIRLTVTSTAAMTTGDVRSVWGVGGTVEANAQWTITVVDGTHIDLQGSTFVNAYTSGGTVSGGFSSWTNLGSAISSRAGAVQWAVQGVTGASQAKMSYDFRFGAGGSQIGPRVYHGAASTEVGVSLYHGPVFCDIPAGTQLQVRALAAGVLNGAQTNLDCAAYLVQ
jgi:hypothetical protein